MHRKRATSKANSGLKSKDTATTAARTTKTPSFKMCIILILISLLVVLLIVRSIGDGGDGEIVQQAQSLAYHGNLPQLRQLIEGHPHINWQHLQKKSKTRSLIHTALFGRHSTIHSSELSGDHEAIIKYLLTEVNWSAKEGCALYYAVHFRNIMALGYLLENLQGTESLECIMKLDTAGQTAWHTAAKSMASGFGRFYSKLLDSDGVARGPKKRVAEILGLSTEAPHQDTPGQVTMAAMNDVIYDIDFSLLLRHYGNHIDLSRLLDTGGNNLLHVASYGGRLSLVKVLLERGISPHEKNRYGWTAIDYAIIAGHKEVAAILTTDHDVSDRNDTVLRGLKLSDTVSHDARLNTLALSRYVKSGWSNKDIKTIAREHHVSSDIPVVDGSKIDDLSKYFDKMKAQRRPYIMTNAFNHWPAWDKWRKEQLIQRYGDMKFTVTRIPYESHYRATPISVNTTLKDYLNTFSTHSDRPMYVFDGNILGRQRSLYKEAPIPSFVDPSSVYLKQFILGPCNSGAPPHFHGHAINGLVYGVKEWYFWRPSDAYFSNQHIMDWKRDSVDGSTGEPSFIKAVQYPGELVYVPENWGHAVINREDSIGVAYEFY